jgi:DNA (cytosine-5)-methyltransferase 1
MPRPTLVSLFAGAGGLDIGLEMAGFSTVMVNEIERHACETLRQNKSLTLLDPQGFDNWFSQQTNQRCYSSLSADALSHMRERLQKSIGRHSFLADAKILEGDIRSLTTDQILDAAGLSSGQITLVAGGPPCQPFSRAGKRQTVETEDGRLFLEFARVVRESRPRWFLFENVKGLAQSRTLVAYFKCDSCERRSIVPFQYRNAVLNGEAKYSHCQECNAAVSDIEITDVRGGSLDIIVNEFESIGYRCYSKILNAADFGVPQSRERLFIVGSRDRESFTWPIATHFENTSAKRAAANLNSRQLPLLATEASTLEPWVTIREVLWQDGHPEFGILEPQRALLWVKNVVRPHAEPVTWTLDRPSPTVGAHQGAKLAIAPEGVPEEQLLRQQWHTKGKRQGDMPPVVVKHAYLSDQDLLKLQTFPPDWYLYGTRMERAFQIGNAVPPRMAAAVGRAILAACLTSVGSKNKTHLTELIS